MKQDVRDRFPKWCTDDSTSFSLILSDDLDSLLSCHILGNLKGYPIHYFYDFTNVSTCIKKSYPAIGVDIDFLNNGRCWSNHVTLRNENDHYNPKCAGLNNVFRINQKNYTDKYAGSTVLQLYSFYDIPLPRDEESLMLLLTIDAAYKGFYSPAFKDTNIKWLKIMELDTLIEVLHNHRIEDFVYIRDKYQLTKKIYLKDGQLQTDLPLEVIGNLLKVDLKLPEDKFEIKWTYKPYKSNNPTIINKSKLISFALTFANYAKYTA